MRLTFKQIREGELMPPWSGPVYVDIRTMSVVFAPLGFHWLLRFGRWLYFCLLRLARRPSLKLRELHQMQYLAYQRGYNQGVIKGAAETRRWISGALQHLASVGAEVRGR